MEEIELLSDESKKKTIPEKRKSNFYWNKN